MNETRYVVEVWGEEVRRYKRLLTVEVPEGTTIDEVEELEMSVFADVPEPPKWELEEAYGIYGCEDYIPEVQRNASDSDPIDCRLVRNASGKLLLEGSEEHQLSSEKGRQHVFD